MFDLEPAIVEWRKRMLAGGIAAPVPLDELEGHLRDSFQRQVLAGAEPARAFAAAVREFGLPGRLQIEFRKNKRMRMKNVTVALASVFGTVLGGGLILPALARWSREGTINFGPLLIGIAMALAGAWGVLRGTKMLRANWERKCMAVLLGLAGIFYVVPLVQSFFGGHNDRLEWAFCVAMAAGSVLFYGGCLRRLHNQRLQS